MSLREKFREPPDEWNHPHWPRRLAPVAAAIGAVVASVATEALGYAPAIGAGVGAGLAVVVAWAVLATLD